jgi:hypothetical protein
VVLEVTNVSLSNGQLRDHKLYRSLSPDLADLLARDFPLISFFCSFSNLYQFNSELFFRSLYYFNRSDQSWINGGTINPDQLDNLIIPEHAKNNMLDASGNGGRALNRIVELCKSRGIEARLIVSPFLPQYIETLSIEDWIRSFRDSLQFPETFFDFRVALRNPAYFTDIIHINRKGGEAFSDIMIDEGVFDGLILPE